MLTIRISRRVAFLVVLGVFLAIPAGSWASHKFKDVPDSNIFHDDISWLADADVTKGCNPPANDEFCPSSAVTREQMAAFMKRLAEARVVDADTVDGQHASAFAAAADNRFISLSPYDALVGDGGTVTLGGAWFGGIHLPDTGNPQVGWGFTLPPDFPTGGTVTVEMLWHTDSTSCGVEFRQNYISVARAGQKHILGGADGPGFTVVGGTTLSAPATANQSSIVELAIVSPDGVTDLVAGDSVMLGMYRATSAVSDTCAGDMTIYAGSVTY